MIWGLAEDQGLRNGGGGDQRLGLDVLHLNVWRQRIGDDEQGLVGWNCQASAANDDNSCDIRFFDGVSFSGQLWPGNGWFNSPQEILTTSATIRTISQVRSKLRKFVMKGVLARRYMTVVGSLVLASCGQPSQARTEPAIPASPPRLTASSARDMPLARYVLSPQDAAIIENAATVLAVPCAARFGVATTLKPNGVSLASDALLLDNRYGVISAESAGRYGYAGDPTNFTEVDNPDKSPANGWNPSASEHEVLTGLDSAGKPSQLVDNSGTKIHEGGCLGEAHHELLGQRNYRMDLIGLVQGGLSDAWNQTMTDSRLQAAEGAWASCMSTRGYAFAHRYEASESVRGRTGPDAIKTAVDDLLCAEQVNFLGIEHAVDIAYQNRYITDRESQFTTAYDGVQAALLKARSVLAASH